MNNDSVAICVVGNDFLWRLFWQSLKGEYVLILSGDEILAPTAVEALYYSAKNIGADVVENTCMLIKQGEVKSFPKDIYEKMMHPIDGSLLPWTPVKLAATVSSRYKMMIEMPNFIHGGTFLISRDFLLKSGYTSLEKYGGIELLLFELLFRAEKYLRIYAPTYAYGESNFEVEPENCCRSLLIAQNRLENLINNVPFLKDKSDWQDNIREKFFQSFKEHYLKGYTAEVWEKAFSKVLSKNHQVNGWLVRYLFGKFAGK